MSPKIAPYIFLPPSFLNVLVDAHFPARCERHFGTHPAYCFADDLVIECGAGSVGFVADRAVCVYAELRRLDGRVDVCAEENELSAVFFLLVLYHASHPLIAVTGA